MNAPRRLGLLLLAVSWALAAVLAGLVAPAAASEEHPEPTILGPTTRAAIEAAEPGWVAAEVAAAPQAEGVTALAAVAPGAEVTVYFGTWCDDSRRELARFWRAIDEAGGEVPFAVEYVAVDRADQRPPELAAEVGLEFVPTFIVRRGGAEVGRIVESSPHGIERDLAALLSGEARGAISGRDDVGEAGGTDGGGATAAP